MKQPNISDMTIDELLAELARHEIETSVHGKTPDELSRYALEMEVRLARRPKMSASTRSNGRHLIIDYVKKEN